MGDESTKGYAQHGLLWRDGRRIVLRDPEPPDGDQDLGCTARTIDDAGVIGGYCYLEENGTVSSIPVLWRGAEPSRPWPYGRVYAFGAEGHLAGVFGVGDNDETLRAALDVGDGPEPLAGLGAPRDLAFGINATDVAVGVSDGRPVVWRGGAVRALPAPSGTGAAYGINRWGTVAGTEGVHPRPVAWKSGLLTPLGPARGSAAAVNDRGDVVGWSAEAPAGRTAIRWHLLDDGS